MAVVEVSITPLGTGNPGGLSAYVSEALKVLKGTGLKHQLTPMGTIIEGDVDEILMVIRRMQETVFESGALRVSTLIKIDDRRDREHTMDGKVSSVLERM